MTRASLLVRLSKLAKDTNLSLEGMLEDCRARAAELGCSIVGEHVDHGKSGAIRDRPGFLAWLRDGTSGAADTLITWSLDRITREGINAAAMVLDVHEGKDPVTGRVVRPQVRLVDCEGLDSADRDAFRWRFLIGAEVARAERERIVARNKATRRRLREAGRWPGGPAPYGTVPVPAEDGKGLVLAADPVTAALVEEMVQRLIDGATPLEVARWLNARGVTTRTGKPWRRSVVLGVVRNANVRRLLLDGRTWRALDDALAERPSTGRPGRPVASLLAGGLGVCGSCGGALTTSVQTKKTGHRYRYYRCASSVDGVPCPRPVSASQPTVDAEVERRYLAAAGRLPWWEQRTVLVGGSDVDGAERAVEEARARMDAERSPEAMAAYYEAVDALEAAKADPPRRELRLVDTGRTTEEVWREASVPERAAMLRRALAEIVIEPATSRGWDPARVVTHWVTDDYAESPEWARERDDGPRG